MRSFDLSAYKIGSRSRGISRLNQIQERSG